MQGGSFVSQQLLDDSLHLQAHKTFDMGQICNANHSFNAKRRTNFGKELTVARWRLCHVQQNLRCIYDTLFVETLQKVMKASTL